MNTYEIERHKEIRTIWPRPRLVKPAIGDVVILKSKTRTRKYIVARDTSNMWHCGVKCGIARSTCVHYDLCCACYSYLKPIDSILENL